MTAASETPAVADAANVLDGARTVTVGSGGWTPPAPADLERLLPRFQILELIGRGGMGAVYKARQRHLDRIVALKILPPELAAESGFSERFAREARALARLSHPHLIALYDFGQDGGLHWMAMEYVDGADLRKVLRTGALSAREVLRLVPQLSEALQYAHDQGVVHRDLKPENILIDSRGRVKIGDFGIAKSAHDSGTLTVTGQTLGSVHYMAPEQIGQAATVDHRADIYSLGVIIYEMLTGELPLGRFELPSQRVVVDVRMDEVVLRSLEREPRRRWQRMAEVGQAVEDVSATTGKPMADPAPPVAAAPLPVAIAPPPAAVAADVAGAPSRWARVRGALRRFGRSRQDRVLCGLCGGLGAHTPLPSWVWRILTLTGMFFVAYVIVPVYLILWLCVPSEDATAS